MNPSLDGESVDRLREALKLGHIPVLVAVLNQLSSDPKWRDERYRPTRTRGLDDHRDGGLPEAIQQEIRDGVLELVLSHEEPLEASSLGAAELADLATFAFGEDVPTEYGEFIEEILDVDVQPGRARQLAERTPGVDSDMRVVVIGAGPSGIVASIRLQAMGIDHVVLEKEPEVGGAWQNNWYPGCGVDTPSYLYSYSFHDYEWTTHYGKRDEVHGYFVDVADKNNVREHTRFGVEVTDVIWDDASSTWHITANTPEGIVTWDAEVVIVGVGQLSRPKVPDLPGMDTFQGQAFHSSYWPKDLDLNGKRVALVGAGASAMQIGPAIIDEVESLTVFQRSPQWIAPAGIYFSSFDDAEHFLMGHVPLYLQWYRARLNWVYNDRVHASLQVDEDWPEPRSSINAINAAHRRYYVRYIEEQLEGRPDLIEQSVPDYPPFGKRMLLDNGWYQMLRRDHATLVSAGVSEITPTGLVDASGTAHEFDVIVFATGFFADRFLYPMNVVGRDGRTTVEMWGEHDARAHLGVVSPNLPNMFFMGGPNTLLGHGGSYIGIAEMQSDYIVRILTRMVEEGAASVECRQDVCDAYVSAVDEAHRRMVWTHPGMDNWYRNPDGRITAVIPWRIVDYRGMLKRAGMDDYVVRGRTSLASTGRL